MATTDVPQARTRPPRPSIDALGWLRENLFSTWYNALISVILLFIIFQVLTNFLGWVFTTQGWPAVVANLKVLMTWTYPLDQMWRPQAALASVALLLGFSSGVWQGLTLAIAKGFGAISALLVIPTFFLNPLPGMVAMPSWLYFMTLTAAVAAGYFAGRAGGERLRWPLIICWLLIYPFVVTLIRGIGGGVLPIVNTNLWGGLMLTLLLATSGIVLSFPLGILLALGRRSDLPVIKWFCIAYIELIRGVPLVTVLFMGALLLPLFIPGGENIDGLFRATVAVTLFSAAYLAENVRGGLQSLPRGQTEAARALGLNTVQTTLLITLPQALRAVIPVLVGQFIGLFKDTSLVVIIGLVDLLGAAQNIVGQPQWLGTPGGVWREAFLFIALIYWVISFSMSRASRSIETKLNVGR
ncbi:MAG: amino acid ABC transporter permease [Oscillochloridaceae bacterium umkhey_bin13]